MSTNIRPEISMKNDYWIERHRYYELKHFCLQYPIWKKASSNLDGLAKHGNGIRNGLSSTSDPTSKAAEAREWYLNKMHLIEEAARESDPALAPYILKGVTEGISYDHLRSKYNIPCGKDMYYNCYRRFFWLLNKTRD